MILMILLDTKKCVMIKLFVNDAEKDIQISIFILFER